MALEAAPREPGITVVVPTRNESDNVPELFRRLSAGSDGERVHVIFVDDSDDSTPQVIRECTRGSRMRVTLLHRPAGKRVGGLGSAVVAGLRLSRTDWTVVMDGDLQHPPELAPALVAAGKRADAQLVVASRRIAAGSSAGLANASRRAVSGSATLVTKSAFPRRLSAVTDPMSGFFAVRTSAVDASSLRPLGFKILLEIIVRSPQLRIAEVPFEFGTRFAGESKASVREGMRFVGHVVRLRSSVVGGSARRWARTPFGQRLMRWVSFGLVGLSGIGVNVGALWIFTEHALRLQYLVAAALATQVSTTWNLILTERLVFRGPKTRRWQTRALAFFGVNNAALLLRLPLLAFMVETVGLGVLLGNVITLALLFIFRFVLSDRVIYRQEKPMLEPTNTSRETSTAAAKAVPVIGAPHLPARVTKTAAFEHPFDPSATAEYSPADLGPIATPPPAPTSATDVPLVRSKDAETDPPVASVGGLAGEPVVDGRGKEPIKIVLDVVNSARALDPPLTRRGSHHLPYRYDVGGIVRIGSQVVLPELEYFRDQSVGRNVDIAIRMGPVGAGPTARATMTRHASPASARYREHLGRIGANFRIDFGDTIDVTAGPLLAHSPHVLYTNVIEALLRFVLVDRGYMLLHSACVEIDGVGVMLSARTDTGKTGTILRLLREKGARFLSDDMTIISASGRASCFPKPLTISHHTLRAIDLTELTTKEWAKLRVQSRVHSKEGRLLGFLIGQFNLPIMAVNAATQRIVPPPKYAVDRLVPCDVIDHTQVEQMFIIARGEADVHDIEHEEAVATLLENTEDAYGFPPFRHFAPAVVIGGTDFTALKARERQILSDAMRTVRVRGVTSPNFSWADDIPTLLADDRAAAPPPPAAPPRRLASLARAVEMASGLPAAESNGHRTDPPGLLAAGDAVV